MAPAAAAGLTAGPVPWGGPAARAPGDPVPWVSSLVDSRHQARPPGQGYEDQVSGRNLSLLPSHQGRMLRRWRPAEPPLSSVWLPGSQQWLRVGGLGC